MDHQAVKQNLEVLIRARYPFVYIQTWEETRVVNTVRDILKGQSTDRSIRRSAYVWSLTRGLQCLHNSGGDTFELSPGRDISPDTAVRLLESIVKQQEHAVYILEDFHPWLCTQNKSANYAVVRKLRDILPILNSGEWHKTIIFTSPVLVIPDDMQKEITVFDYPLPNADHILSSFRSIIEQNGLKHQLSDGQLRELAQAALGMTLQESENAFSRAIIRDRGLTPAAIDVIFEEKKQVIRKGGLMEYIDSDVRPEDIGGLDVLKKWLQKRKGSWNVQKDGFRLPAPKGVLITGVPGCGKSLTAKAMSHIWGLPLIKLDMGKIYSGIVGSSEENIRRAIQTAEAMAPCVLWIDEIEKGLAGVGSNGDSGTSTRVFGSLLTWMQEKKSMVFIVATANDISALKPELLRKGRFDEIFFVDLPNSMERRTILNIHIQKHMCPAMKSLRLDEPFLSKLTEITNGFVGAELEAVVLAALFDAYAENRNVVAEDFFNAVRNTVPLSVTQSEQVEALRDWASTRAIAATTPEPAEAVPQTEPQPKRARKLYF
ncbi:MAG: AAA family ATPase [Clostridia bacterium]|nr:AAA family ATPase [Clostridia bacterium]